MDEISSKYVLIAVGIFVTIIILTSVLMAFNKTQEVYELAKNTNISIKSRIDNIYAQYDGAKLNGVALLNTMKKYGKDDAHDEDGILVIYPSQEGDLGVKKKAETNGISEVGCLEKCLFQETGYVIDNLVYYAFYNVNVTETNGKYKITFDTPQGSE